MIGIYVHLCLSVAKMGNTVRGGATSNEMSVLRAPRRQSGGFPREQGRRSDPPAPGMPWLREALHYLRTHRRNPVSGGEERWPPRKVRSSEIAQRVAEGLREAAGEHG